MRKVGTTLIIALLCGIMLPQVPTIAAAGASYYVATTGSDTNPGTLAQPWRTIQRGADLAKPGDTIVIRGGTYFEQVLVTRGGTTGAPVTFQAYPGEAPIVDASMEVTGWSPVGNGVYRAAFTHGGAARSANGYDDDAFAQSTCPDAFALLRGSARPVIRR